MFPWIKSKSDLKQKCQDEPDFRDGKFKEANNIRTQVLVDKAKQLHAQGKDLTTARLYCRLPPRVKEDFSEENCKKVQHQYSAKHMTL